MTLGRDLDDMKERLQEGVTMKRKLLDMNLKLFDGGTGGAGGAGGASGGIGTGAAGSTASVSADSTSAGTEQGGAAADQETGESTQQLTPEERRAAYEKMREDYKDLYAEDVQRSINRLHARNQKLTQQVDSHTPLIDMLAARYGVEDRNVESIMAKIEQDDSFYEERAMQEGMTTEQYKKFAKMEAQNRQLMEARTRAENLRQQNESFARWDREAAECAAKYPGFNIQQEIQSNPQFVKLLGAGIDVISAYQAAHFDEITGGIIAKAEQSTAKRVADTIRSGAERPVENAAGSVAPAKTVTDISSMSDEDFKQFVRDIQAGKIRNL